MESPEFKVVVAVCWPCRTIGEESRGRGIERLVPVYLYHQAYGECFFWAVLLGTVNQLAAVPLANLASCAQTKHCNRAINRDLKF